MMKTAILAEQNFNLIDGSTIWLLNVCKLLALQTDMDVHLVLTHPLTSNVLAQELPANIAVDDAAQILAIAEITDTQLRAETLTRALEPWERAHGRFDRIFVRGTDYLCALLKAPAFQNRVVAYAPNAIPDLAAPDPEWVDLARKARTPVVIQSQAAKRAMESLLDYPANLVHVVPPIVFPTTPPTRPPHGPAVLCYSGKIDLHYGLDWLIDLCQATSPQDAIGISLIAGKDTYRVRYRDFFRRMDGFRVQIEKGTLPHVSLVSNVPHSKAKALMGQADFGYCLRHDRYDDVIEISTKIVEFCTLDVPPILNDNALNRDLFGQDYPYFIDIAEDDVSKKLKQFLASRHSPEYQAACNRIADIAARFSANTLSDSLGHAIRGWSAKAPSLSVRDRKIHIAAHDTKFLTKFLDRIRGDQNIALSHEPWASTTKPKGRPGVPQDADIVLCEWCCENAVWHSNNKRPGQKLIVRLHRFEAFRDFPARVRWENVDALIVVSDWFQKCMVENHGVDPARIHVIPQYIDWHGLQRPKLPEARHTIGLVGINPFEHKRIDRAVDFFANLHERDPRFKLAIRSAMPWEIDWVWNNDDDARRNYEAVFERIFKNYDLADAIRFDPAGPDMEEWYRGIGVILSSSDSEGCHTAVIEGMAAGCLPVVNDWPGARSLFTPHVYTNITDAIPDIIAFANDKNQNHRQEQLAQTARKYDVESFTQAFMNL